MIQVTEASANDVIKVKKIELKCGLCNWSENDYLSEIDRPDSLFYVAWVENELVAFVLARLIMKDNPSLLNNLNDGEGQIEIYNIGVMNEYRKKSIASNLLEMVFNAGTKQNVKTFYLEVRKSNKNAIDFYRKHCFEVVGERKNYYTNPIENALLMNRNYPI